MGNRYIRSNQHKNIHIIEKGPREKDCSVCSNDLSNEDDKMFLLILYPECGYAYLCFSCFDDMKALVYLETIK